MWIGLVLSYEIPSLPTGTAVIGVATASFAGAALLARLRRRIAAPVSGGGSLDEPRFVEAS